MLNEKIVVRVTPYSGSNSTDKNNKESVMLQCIAGKMPNRNVLAGTVAERAGFEVGKTYLAQVREAGFDVDFGRDFTFLMIEELHGVDIMDVCDRIGAPEIITIEKPDGFKENYHRKGDAVESIRTQRIKEGKYRPITLSSSFDHSTASKVVAGSSQEDPASDNLKKQHKLDKDERVNLNDVK